MKFNIITGNKGLHDLRSDDCFSDKMTKKQALELSIQKWKKIVEHLEANPQLTYIMRDGNIETCALCSKFYEGAGPDGPDFCKKCPVYENTGKRFCSGTPYTKFTKIGEESYYRRTGGNVVCTPTMAKKRLEAAWAELTFLESLRK